MAESPDWFLIKNDVSERAICHKLADYVQAQFPDWDVDCEYNRNFAVEALAKKLFGNGQEFGWFEDDDGQVLLRDKNSKMRHVLPDIIIHKRGKKDNHIVMEVKKSTNLNGNNENYDKTKLRAFKENPDFNYRYALFVVLDKSLEKCRAEEIK